MINTTFSTNLKDPVRCRGLKCFQHWAWVVHKQCSQEENGRMAECHSGPDVMDGVLAVAMHSNISKFRVLTNIDSFLQYTKAQATGRQGKLAKTSSAKKMFSVFSQ